MRNSISKAIVAGVAALGVSAAVVVPTEPALAQWHGGGGGWHGGGGGWHGGGWRGGWGGGRAWHPGYWNGGVWYNGWWGPAIAAGVLTGAAIASYPYWGGMGTAAVTTTAAGPIGRPTTATAASSASSGSTSASDRRRTAQSKGPRRKRGPFHLGAGQKAPPVIGFGTPVVVGKESGAPRRERRAR